MNLAELRKQPHLSVSAVNAYIDCGLYYKFARVDKRKPAFKSDNLVFGSCIHKAIADYNQNRLYGTRLTLKEFLQRFEIYWIETAKGNADIGYSKGKDYEALLQDGKKLLTIFHEESSNDGFTILAIEEPFQMRIDGLDIPFIGVIDMIEEDESASLIITDYKTSGKAYSSDKIDNSLQLTIYHMAAIQNGFRDREILLKFDCLIKTQKPKFEQYYTTRTQIDFKRAERKIQSVWEGIQKGAFMPNDTSWKCNYCEYKKDCTEWMTGGEHVAIERAAESSS